MAEAGCPWLALLDADDEWRPEFLETMSGVIEEFPGAGLYCGGFEVERGGRLHAGRTPRRRGVVEDYFDAAMRGFVATASSVVLPREVVDRVGGFPEGMRLGGDQYMWTKIALERKVVFTPRPVAVIHAGASNRSAAIYSPESTRFSFRDFHDPARPAVNEYIARVGLGKAISAVVRGGSDEGRQAERDWSYNRLSRRLWWRLWLLNRLPVGWRPVLNGLYQHLAWLLFRRGF
jgi:hypothetical protein